jgi:hypothetical protein
VEKGLERSWSFTVLASLPLEPARGGNGMALLAHSWPPLSGGQIGAIPCSIVGFGKEKEKNCLVYQFSPSLSDSDKGINTCPRLHICLQPTYQSI